MGGLGPALAQSQGASPAREEGKHPFVCSLGFCSRVSGDKSQVGRGAWRLSRRPRPWGTGACGGAGAGAACPRSRPATLLPPPLGPLRGHLLQEASGMWPPSCLRPLASEPLRWGHGGEPPERRDLRGWAGGALLWSSVARLCRRPLRPAAPGAAELHACFLPLPLTQPHFLSASQPPGSSSPACILSTRHPPGHRASVPHPGVHLWKRPAACRQAPSPRSTAPLACPSSPDLLETRS